MSDSLISPVSGASMWLLSGVSFTKSAAKIAKEKKINLLFASALAAFVFSAQMLNFSIPGTGSSGHFCGGILLSALLGPHAGFIVMSVILILQSFLFADGGILALGCNIFNMAFIPSFIVYPFIYRIISEHLNSKQGIFIAGFISSVVALQLGAFSVVLETFFSGISQMPFSKFLYFMLPIHLAIGIIEGFITGLLLMLFSAKQAFVHENTSAQTKTKFKVKTTVLSACGIIIVAILSSFASENPDGLEWSLAKSGFNEDIVNPSKIHALFSALQEKTALLADYDLASIKYGTEISGTIGFFATFAAAALLFLFLNKLRKDSSEVTSP